jgi:hypothetical protein
MAAPSYTTDLTNIFQDDPGTSQANWTAIGTGGAGLNTETDYYIQGSNCISKNGWTGAIKGMIYGTGATITVAAGDAIFIWSKQNNRNLLTSEASGGVQVIIGNSTSAYDHFYVDGNDSEGSDLAGWRNYAVDPTQTPSTTTGGGGTNTDYTGILWNIGGSGTLKGAPNGIDAFRHGREIRCTDGDAGNGYATFDGAATWDANTTRAWGLLTPALGNYLFHGAFVMGLSGTSVDFRDSNRAIFVLDDPFVPSTFNEFEIRNVSSNVEWTNIQISHQGTVSPATMTLNVGTFTGESCRFDGCATTTFNSNGSSSCILTTWANSGQIVLNEADISGSSILTSTVAADEGAVYDNRTTTAATNITELDNCTFSQGTNAHHAIRFGANVNDDITLTGIEFTGFSSTDDVNGSTLRFDATSGSMNVNLIDCTVGGSPATTANIGVDDAAGITVTLVINPVTTKITVTDTDGTAIQSARVLVETADDGGGSGFMFEEQPNTLTQTGGTATMDMGGAHGLATNDYVVIRNAQPDGYNKQAQITSTGANTFTYSVDSGLSSPATGQIAVSYAPISGTTDVNGEIQSSKTWPIAQGAKGWVRKSTSAPYYRQSAISIADASGGSDVTVQLISDE